jgi:hypothetical protein
VETCERQPQHYDTAGRPEVPPKFRRATCDLRPKTVGSRTSYGLRSQVSGPRSQVSGPRSQVYGPRSQVYGPRSQVSGPGSQVSGPRSRVPGLRSQVPGPRSQVSGLRSQVSGPTSQAPRLRSQVSGPKSQAPGLRTQVRFGGRAAPGARRGGFLPAQRPCLCRQATSSERRLRRQSQPTHQADVLHLSRLDAPRTCITWNSGSIYP